MTFFTLLTKKLRMLPPRRGLLILVIGFSALGLFLHRGIKHQALLDAEEELRVTGHILRELLPNVSPADALQSWLEAEGGPSLRHWLTQDVRIRRVMLLHTLGPHARNPVEVIFDSSTSPAPPLWDPRQIREVAGSTTTTVWITSSRPYGLTAAVPLHSQPQHGGMRPVLLLEMVPEAVQQRFIPAQRTLLAVTALLSFFLLALAFLDRFPTKGQPHPALEISLILCTLLLLNTATAWLLAQNENRMRNQHFQFLCQNYLFEVREHIRNLEEQTLPAFAHFLQQAQPLTQSVFASYTTDVTGRFPMEAWSLQLEIPLAQRETILSTIRSELDPNFQMWEWDELGHRQPSALRPESYPVLFRYSQHPARAWIGYDSASEAIRRDSLSSAAARGRLQATPPIPLAARDGNPGSVIYLPIERELAGAPRFFLSTVLDWHTLFNTGFPPENATPRLLQLHAAHLNPAPETLLGEPPPPVPRFQKTFPLFAFGHSFAVTLSATPAFLTTSTLSVSRYLWVFGAFLSLVLAFLFSQKNRFTLKLQDEVARQTHTLREVSARFQALSDPLPMGVALIDRSLSVLQTNPKMLEWFPRLADADQGLCYELLNLQPAAEPCEGCAVREALAGETPKEFHRNVETAEGQRHLKITVHPILESDGHPGQALEIVEDVTDQFLSEQQSRHQRELLRRITEITAHLVQAGDASWDQALDEMLATLGSFLEMDRASIFLMEENATVISNTHEWCAQGVPSFLGQLQDLGEADFPWWFSVISGQRVLRLDSLDDLPPDALQEREECLRENIQSQLFFSLVDGSETAFGCFGFDSSIPHPHWSDVEISLLQIFADILSGLFLRRRDKLHLEDRESQYRHLVDNSLNGVLSLELICDTQGNPVDLRVLSANPATRHLLGLPPQQLQGERASTVLPALLQPDALSRFAEVALQRTARSFDLQIPFGPMQREYTVTSYSLGGLRIAAIFNEVTEQKRAAREKEHLQQQLYQAQKTESIGRLAGGVAHDFNNALQIILGSAEMALNFHDPNETLRGLLDQIRSAATHSSSLTHQLLAFARKQPFSPKVLDLNATVESLLKMLRRLIGEDIELIWLPAKLPLHVYLDPNQIHQMLVNLCVNARDAIRTAGTITLKTEVVHLSEAESARREGTDPGPYASLSVEDTGQGIPADVLPNIFEPFFTTKPTGEGTGLGLAMVQGIVLQNHGFLNVFSTPGKGTRFQLHFPFSPVQPAIAPATGTLKLPSHDNRHILIVEDEPMILQMAALVLRKLGYTVTACDHPAAALSRLEAPNAAFDLLLTDVIMPEMDGAQLAEHAMRLHPGIRVLYMSGYTADIVQQHGVTAEDPSFIHKPFTIEQISTKLREIFPEA